MHQQWKPLAVTLAAALCGALLFAVVLSWPQRTEHGVYADQVASAQQARENLTTAEGLSAAFRNVSESLRPSVVSIRTEITSRQTDRRGGGLPPELRRQLPPWLDDDFFAPFEQPRQPRQRRQQGMGSGVIIRDDGYLLTNNHVVEGADQVFVTLSDGRRLEAEIVGTDPPTDLAVLKLEATGLEAAILGDSDEIQVGDWVLAVGSPFGLEQTVTAGIISGKHRVQQIIGDGQGFEDFLQTDAAINPGNSGGPLVNLRGEVVGINTAILSRSGASAGIGFAIPVGLARPVVESIIETGTVRRGFLGASVGDVNPETKETFGLKADAGALISGVLEGQPAAEGGLQPGDVVVEIDGREVTTGTKLRNYVASKTPGSTVEMTVDRDGEMLTLQVPLGERTDEAMAMFEGGPGAGDTLIGAELAPLTEEMARELGIRGDVTGGLVVTRIEDGGLAARAGLRAGDLLEEAGGRRLQSVADLRAALEEAQQQQSGLRLLVRRGNSRILLVIR